MPNPNTEKTREWLRSRREARGLSQYELSQLVGGMSIGAMEHDSGASTTSLKRLAEHLGEPPHEVWEETVLRTIGCRRPTTALGHWLLQYRIREHLTQVEAAAKVGVTQGLWGIWERNDHGCQPRFLVKLIAILGEPPADVLAQLKWSAPHAGKYGQIRVESRTEVGKRLRAARATQRWSAAIAAEKLGFPVNTLFCWELGWRNPSLKNLLKAADVYGVSLDWLLCREDKINVPT